MPETSFPNRPGKPAKSGASHRGPRKSLVVAERRKAPDLRKRDWRRRANLMQDGCQDPRAAYEEGTGRDGQGEGEARYLRRLLLHAEQALRAEPRRALPHLQARRARPG